MDHDELVRLSGLARGGDLVARNSIVMANTGLIYRVVGQCLKTLPPRRRSVVSREDLFQAGALGVIRAAEIWDPGRGVRFSTYATMAIHSHVATAIHEGNTIAPSFGSARLSAKWRRLEREGLGEPEIVGRLGLGAPDVARVKDALAVQSATFGPFEDWGGDVVAMQPTPLEAMVEAEGGGAESVRVREVREAMAALTPNQRVAIEMKYGMGDHEPGLDRDIAVRLGCIRSNVSYLVKRAHQRLATLLSA